jgi:hypothetical protein
MELAQYQQSIIKHQHQNPSGTVNERRKGRIGTRAERRRRTRSGRDYTLIPTIYQLAMGM